MISRRGVLGGLAGLSVPALSACASRQQPAPQALPSGTPGLDAVIDISYGVQVYDFQAIRRSNILAIIHKATEGGDWVDPSYGNRQPQAEAAGLLWGTYHFGTGQTSGARQAAFYLSVSRPGPRTLLALDLEDNENNPRNSMRLDQAEEFVKAVADATGRLPVVYVHPTWANGDPLPNGQSFGARIMPGSILARCGLWVADYHDSPEVPAAWQATGWRLWQYAGDESAARPAYGQTTIVRGVSHCDRNLFNGNAAALNQFWGAGS